MDAYDLVKWRETYFGADRAAAARRMGIARNSLTAYEEGKRIPPYIPLICAAIAANLQEWELPPNLKRKKRENPEITPLVAPVGRPPSKRKDEAA